MQFVLSLLPLIILFLFIVRTKKYYFVILGIPIVTLLGGFESFNIGGAGRTFMYSDVYILVIFPFFIFNKLITKKKFCDSIAILFSLRIFLLFVSALFSFNLLQSSFLYPFKNFVIFLLIYLMFKNTIVNFDKFKDFICIVLCLNVLLCFQSFFGIMQHDLSDIVNDRSLKFAGGLTWNSLSGSLSLIYPFLLLALNIALLQKKKIFLFLSCISLLLCLITILISGGRQAIATVIISSLLFIVYTKKYKIYYNLVMLVVFFISVMFVMFVFSDFYEFFLIKLEKFIPDLIQRLDRSFFQLLLNIDYSKYFILGDGISSTHNMITTIIVKFGVLGLSLFLLQMFLIQFNASRLRLVSKNYFINVFAFPVNKFIFVLLLNFFITNMIANLWYQVSLYGYVFWMFVGSLMGILEYDHEVAKYAG